MKTFILPLCLILISVGCGNSFEHKNRPVGPSKQQSDQPITNPTDGATEEPVDEIQINFSRIQSEIFVPRCLSCHSEYEDYNTVVEQIDMIESEIASNRMPRRGGPLTNEQKDLLNQWINEGLLQ